MYIKIKNTKYYAYTAGHAPTRQRQSVVFVHGAACEHSVWALQSRYFAYHGYNIIALDLPGHGLSDGKPMNRIQDYADWVAQIVAASVGANTHLVGHSMGALIALETAAQLSRSVVASLTLLGFSYPMAVSDVLLDAAQHNPPKAYSMMTQWSHTSPIGGEPNPGFWSSGSQMRMLENSKPGTVYTDLLACNNYLQGQDALAKTDCPILFISGAQDKMAPPKLAQKQANNNPLAEIVILPKCGHNIMSENPDGVRDALNQHIFGCN